MTSIIKFSLLALFLTLMSKGTLQQQCTYNNLKFIQASTGAKVNGKPEWKVIVKNDCICTQSNIRLSCSGFQTVKLIDPSILTIGKDTCLLLKNDRIYGFREFSFTYAWDTQFPFKAVSSDISCS
ncbi:hypothetical protein M9H77_00959 [Catharanthus roseus]|uniref:Uncharacterized protein n=1 Tax=Catharanthus roseus TaxID=4058 RepID=A0ACC0C455_CATRO|nr:hypothetical protein M9H77_00959 [Catharanthus roseus]